MSGRKDKGRVVGRYVLYDEIASGGMASIHLGRMLGQVGFARTVAIKRLHPHFAKDPEFVAMFIDEARLAAGIRHPNVVATLDIVALEGELFLVMEYVEGESLSHLIKASHKRGQRVPPKIASAIVSNILYGLHAAHGCKDERGEPLHIVHRDVSPQNVLVSEDGIARVVDFGVAKASRRILETEAGRLKGKFRYMAPEQIRHDRIDHRIDVFAAGVVLWEVITGKNLFVADEPMRVMTIILEQEIVPPSSIVPTLPKAIDEVVLRALARDPEQRYQTAREFAMELEKAIPPAVPRVVGEWVEDLVGELLRRRAARLVELGGDGDGRSQAEVAREVLGTPSGHSGSIPARVVHEPEDIPEDTLPLPDAEDGVTRVMDQQADPAPPEPPDAGRVDAPPPAAATEPADATAVPLPVIKTPPDSQISDVSTASWDTAAKRSLFPPGPAGGRNLIAVGVIMGAALAIGLVALIVGLRKSRPNEAIPAGSGQTDSFAAAAAAAPPAPPAPPAEVEKAPEPEPAVTPPPTPEPVAEKPAPKATAPKLSPASKPEPAAEAPPPPTTVKKPAASDCNPPWTIDKDGIKKFKRHCT